MQANNKISYKCNRHLSYDELMSFLVNLSSYNLAEQSAIKQHLAICRPCWDLWNKVRWDRAKNTQGLLELKEYLGDKFQEYFDSSWAIANSWNEQNPITDQEIANFYKNNNLYLYNLVIWHECGQRYRLRKEFEALKTKYSLKTAIDYGCGVGTDTLELIDLGFKVTGIDYQCPSIDFLHWRLKKRQLSAEFLDVDQLKQLPANDLFIAIDVLEHIANPLKIINLLMETNNKVFAHISQFNDADSAGQRHPLHFSFSENKINNLLKNNGYVHEKNEHLSIWVKV